MCVVDVPISNSSQCVTMILLANTFRWNVNKNTTIFKQENFVQYIVLFHLGTRLIHLLSTQPNGQETVVEGFRTVVCWPTTAHAHDWVANDSLHCGPGTNFTKDFSITIQIRWKFHLALIQLLEIISTQNLAHATTAPLSCHVPNFVEIHLLVFGWEQNEISITFELWWKNR